MSDRGGPTSVERWIVDCVVLQKFRYLSYQREKRTGEKIYEGDIFVYIHSDLLSPSDFEKRLKNPAWKDVDQSVFSRVTVQHIYSPSVPDSQHTSTRIHAQAASPLRVKHPLTYKNFLMPLTKEPKNKTLRNWIYFYSPHVSSSNNGHVDSPQQQAAIQPSLSITGIRGAPSGGILL